MRILCLGVGCLGLAAATAVAVIVALSIFHAPNAPMIQLAMLDTVGGTRGADTNELATLREAWKGIPVQNFSSASELEAWEKNWPNGDEIVEARFLDDSLRLMRQLEATLSSPSIKK